MSPQSQSFVSGVGDNAGPLTAVVGFTLLLNIIGLFTYTGVALCVFGYVALTLGMMTRAGRGTEASRAMEAGTALIVVSWCIALMAGAAVGAFHWVEFAHAAYAVLGVYAAAVFVWVIGRALSAAWSFCFPAVGIALLTAVTQLAAPPGSDDMEKAESWTPVSVTAVDESGEPIDGASVYLDLVNFWEGDPEFDGERKWWTKQNTDETGLATMVLHEDPRFKRLVIRVRHAGFDGGFNEPSTIAAYVAHEDARIQTSLPAHKVPYFFRVVMNTRPHPESAYLAIELDAPDFAERIVSRSLKLAVVAGPDLPWDADRRTIDEQAVADDGLMRDVYLSKRERFVIKLNRDLIGTPLSLHVLEREFPRNEETLQDCSTVSLGSIAPGSERVVPTIVLSRR